jgi:hypothetical protein
MERHRDTPCSARRRKKNRLSSERQGCASMRGSRNLLPGEPQGDVELMTEKQVLGLKPATRT